MRESFYNEGAVVQSLDGKTVGTVDHLTGEGDSAGLVVRLEDGDRTLFVPYAVIDHDASTEDRVLIQGAVGDLLEPQMGIDEHDGGTIQLAAEEATAHVHEVDRGRVLIHKHVEMVPHRADVDVSRDIVDVERVPVDEVYDSAPQTREEGDELIVPVVEEVLVVVKRYRVIEEVRVKKTRETETKVFEEELKREVVDVTEEDIEGENVRR